MKPKLETSLFWHNIWKECGRPRQGNVADIMRRTRAQYHHAVKYARKEHNNIRNTKMAEAISRNKNRDLWKEVKSMTQSKQELPSVIDGQVGNENIVNIFYEKSKNLYNTVGFTPQSIQQLKQKIDRKIAGNCILNNDEINLVTTRETFAQYFYQ